MQQSFSLDNIPVDNASWSALDAEAFQACGTAIRAAVSRPPTEEVLKQRMMPAVRAWLDEATLRQDSRTATTWGLLSMSLTEDYAKGPITETFFIKHFFGDRNRLAGYLNAMSNVAEEDLFRLGGHVSIIELHETIRYRSRPACEALSAVLGSLVGDWHNACTPMLQALVKYNAWKPDALLERMRLLLPGQLEYQRAKRGPDEVVATMPHGRVLTLLATVTLSTNWRPDDTPLFGDIWDAFSSVNPNEEQATTLMVRLLESMPSQAARGLTLVIDKEDMTPAQVALFFPLPVEQCEPQALLLSIVVILAMTRADAQTSTPLSLLRSKRFEDDLEKHHPALANLMALHFSLFPETSRKAPNTTTLLEAFKLSAQTTKSVELPILFADSL